MPDAFWTDACPDRVEAWFGGGDSDLRAQSRFARDGADLNRAGFDFGDLGLEQAVHEGAGGARNADLRLARVALCLEDDNQSRAPGMQLLAWDLLLGGHHSFDPTQVDVDGPVLDAVHNAAAQLPSVLGHVAEHLVALQVMYVPQHSVLCRLGG